MTYEHAKEYESRGFKMLKIIPRTKNPAGTWINGTKGYVNAEFYKNNPEYGIGIIAGSSSGIYIIDVDSRSESENYFQQFGINISEYRHKTACFHRGNQNKYKLVFNNPKKEDLQYVNLLHTELRADAKHQDVFPPSIHESGQQYVWENDLDNMIDLPAEIRTVWQLEISKKSKILEAARIKSDEKRKTKSGDNVFETYNRLVGADQALREHGYIPIGTKWKPAQSQNTAGIVVYDGYIIASKHTASDPMANYIHITDNDSLAYTPFHMLWYLDYNGDATAATAEAYKYCESQGYSFDDPDTIINVDELLKRVEEKKSPTDDKPYNAIPEHLLSIPGNAQGLVDAYNQSALIPQPQFAVQSALAIVATLMGRRFMTAKLENMTNLYLDVVGDSSSGKNHCKKFIKTVLGMVDVYVTNQNTETHYCASKLIGGGEYKSSAGFFRACARKPCHITIIDESGIKADSQNKSEHGAGIKGALLESWSSATSAIYKGNYSGGDITFDEIQKEKDKPALDEVRYPCVIKFGISTPSTYYAAMKAGDIESGYLGRHIIVESAYHDREINIDAPKIQDCVSNKTLNWLKSIFTAYSYSPNSDMFDPLIFMVGTENPTTPVEPITMYIYHDSLMMFKALYSDIIKKYGRDNPLVMKGMEMSVRVSMIVAISCESLTINIDHATWAKDYVCFYLSQMVKSAEMKIAGSKYESDWKELYEIIMNNEGNGANTRDFTRKSSAWVGATTKQQAELLQTMINLHDVVFCQINNGKPGPKRYAWVCPDFFDPDVHIISEYDFNKHRVLIRDN